jgi:hypothetical protein
MCFKLEVLKTRAKDGEQHANDAIRNGRNNCYQIFAMIARMAGSEAAS